MLGCMTGPFGTALTPPETALAGFTKHFFYVLLKKRMAKWLFLGYAKWDRGWAGRSKYFHVMVSNVS